MMSNNKKRNTIPDDTRPESEPSRAQDPSGEETTEQTPRGEARPRDGGQAETERAQSPEAMDAEAVWAKRVEKAEAEAEKFKDQLLRKAAEFENYKRRTEIDWQTMQRFAVERVLLAFLPVLDDVLRSLKSGAEQKSFDAFYQGVELIYQKMLKTFKEQGVEPIEAVGKPFSVEEHDALLQIPREDVAPHTVIEEVEKGYRLGDRVLRHAKVIVSAEASEQGRQHDEA